MKEIGMAACLLLFSVNASACECSKDTVDEGMSSAELVFGASVIGAKVKGLVMEIEIDAFAPLKGEATPLKKIITPSSSSGCGFTVSVPERYVFFATKDGKIDNCGATRKLGDPDLGVLTSKVIRIWGSTAAGGAGGL